MVKIFDPYPPEARALIARMRDAAQPARSHIAPGASPADVLRLIDIIDDLANRCRSQEVLLLGDLRTLPSDEFIARALAEHAYRADLETGEVFNVTTGQSVGRIRSNGYVEALFRVAGIHRSVHLHRVVSVAAWGVDAVRSKQIAHLNHNKGDNRLVNLAVMTEKDHAKYDYAVGARRSYRAGTKCQRCGFLKGEGAHRWRNRMTSGAMFGIDGPLCDNCYHILWRETKKGNRDVPAAS